MKTYTTNYIITINNNPNSTSNLVSSLKTNCPIANKT